MSNAKLDTLLAAFVAASPEARESIALQIKALSTPAPTPLKDTRVVLKDGRLSFTGARQTSCYAHQFLAELGGLVAAVRLVSYHLGGDKTIANVMVARAWQEKPAKYEDHVFVGKLDVQNENTAAQLQARFDAACEEILRAANWVEDYRTTPEAQVSDNLAEFPAVAISENLLAVA